MGLFLGFIFHASFVEIHYVVCVCVCVCVCMYMYIYYHTVYTVYIHLLNGGKNIYFPSNLAG